MRSKLNSFLRGVFLLGLLIFITPGRVLAVTRVDIFASDITAKTGEIISVDVAASDFSNLYSAELHLQYDPAILLAVDEDGNTVTKAGEGDIFTANKFVAENLISPEEGKVDYAVTFLGGINGRSGEGILLKMKFKILKEESAAIQFADLLLLNNLLDSIPLAGNSVVINPDSAGGSENEPGSSDSNGGDGSTQEPIENFPADTGGNTSTTDPDIIDSSRRSTITGSESQGGDTPGDTAAENGSNEIADTATARGFTDMQGHWAQEAVDALFRQELINGYEDGTFKPDNYISRAEIVVLLARGLGLAGAADGRTLFTDDPVIPDWARRYVAAALRDGLIKGYEQADGSCLFAGERFVSRGEYAVLLARILEKNFGNLHPAQLFFTDADAIPDWAIDAVGIALAGGIIEGYEDDSFRASGNVSRAEAAVILKRVLYVIELK